MADDFWTEEKQDELRRLWERGLSGSVIAKKLGAASRSAILGKIHRMRREGYEFVRPVRTEDVRESSRVSRAGGAARTAAARARATRPKATNNLAAVNAARRAERTARKTFAAPKPTVIDASFARPWTEREFGMCAYPVSGEGADTFSCCAPTGGATYCPGHAARMFVKPERAGEAFVKNTARLAA